MHEIGQIISPLFGPVKNFAHDIVPSLYMVQFTGGLNHFTQSSCY